MPTFNITTQQVTSTTPVVIAATWRVKSVKGAQPTVRTFTVKPPTGPLPAPVLEFPANGATVTGWAAGFVLLAAGDRRGVL